VAARRRDLEGALRMLLAAHVRKVRRPFVMLRPKFDRGALGERQDEVAPEVRDQQR
jgi:hypothetical protein